MAVAMIAAGCGSDDEAAPAKQAVTTTAAPARRRHPLDGGTRYDGGTRARSSVLEW
ncbi:MAG: hypothetical protein Ct9H300mP12_09830 [Acidimicrobiales bacterium]|nr:MAG: hypothetical protein Ct9H300mP12_09830 [Acidimicrobiales bacterium]